MDAWQALVVTGTGLAVALYGYINAQDEAWDGESTSLVEEIAESLNDTGLTEDEDIY